MGLWMARDDTGAQVSDGGVLLRKAVQGRGSSGNDER